MSVVTMPDGTLVTMPDNPTPEQLSALQAVQSKAPAEPGFLERLGRTALSSFGKAAQAAPEALSYLPGMESLKEVADSNREFYDEVGKKGIQNRWGRALVEGGAGALAGGTATGLKSTAITLGGGIGSGVGGEVAETVAPGNPIARTLGSVAGGVAGGMGTARLASKAPTIQNVVREATAGLPEGALAKAQAFQAEAAKQGVKLDLAQALEGVGVPAPDLKTIRDLLANSRYGKQVQDLLTKQPVQVETAADLAISRIPGKVQSPEIAANDLTKAATDRIELAREARTGLWESTLERTKLRLTLAGQRKLGAARAEQSDALERQALENEQLSGAMEAAISGKGTPAAAQAQAGPATLANARARQALEATDTARAELASVKRVPGSAVQEVADKLARLAEANPGIEQGTAMLRLRAKLFVKGEPITDPTKLNNILKSEANKLKSATLADKGVSIAESKWIGLQIQEIRKDLGKSFEPLRNANEAYSNFTTNVVNPLKQGPVGTLAGRRGYTADAQNPTARMAALFEAGTDPQASSSSILTAGRELRQTDPTAFANAVRTHYSGKLSNVLETNSASPETAAKLWTEFFGNRKQVQGMKDAVTVVAENAGVDAKAAVKGLDTFEQLLRAAKSRPNTLGGLSRQELAKLGGQSKLSTGLRMTGFLPLKPVAMKIEDWTLGRTMRQFDEIIATPQGAELLAKLSKVPIMSDGVVTLLSTFNGGSGASEGQ